MAALGFLSASMGIQVSYKVLVSLQELGLS